MLKKHAHTQKDIFEDIVCHWDRMIHRARGSLYIQTCFSI